MEAVDITPATPKHWKHLKKIRSALVEPREFRNKWDITNEQMARLLDLSAGHVNCWFFKETASRYRIPEDKHKRRLAEIDFIWNQIDKVPSHLRKYYSEFKD